VERPEHKREMQPQRARPAPTIAPARASAGKHGSSSRRPSGVVLAGLAAGGLLVAAALSVGLIGPFGPRGGEDGSDDGKPASAKPQGMTMIRPVVAKDTERAIAALMMTEPQKAEVRTALSDGRLRLGWITVSDVQAEDGDWVRLAAGPFLQDVRLLHKPYTIAVPYMPGMPVTVTGLVDGGGGDITVAVYLGSSQISLKPLKKGEVLQIPSP